MAEGADGTDVAPPEVSYEALALIEDEFEEIDTEIMRQQYNLSTNAYLKRTEAVAKIPHFWPLVFEQAPVDIDQYVQPQDSRILAESLTGFTVTRPELDENPKTGNPRSLKFRFEFAPNDDFEDTVLEKTVWYRRAQDGWTGLVSEPVRISWKKDKDVTNGLTDMSAALWEKRKAMGDMVAQGLPEYTALRNKVEHWNGMNTSFFTWFGWVSNRRWVSAEESKKANAEFAARKKEAKLLDLQEDELEDQDDSLVEVHQAGDELAISLAEEVWPSAIKLFTQAQEDDELSEADFEDDDFEDEEDDDEPVDIRALVEDRGVKGKSRRESDGPPAKKQKK